MACVADHDSIEAGGDKEEATWKKASTRHVCGGHLPLDPHAEGPSSLALQVESLACKF